MKGTRKKHSAEFKARVAREAMGGVKTVAQIAEENGGHPAMVSSWKREAESNLAILFERRRSAASRQVLATIPESLMLLHSPRTARKQTIRPVRHRGTTVLRKRRAV